ncbi:MAG: phosphonoacetaldehyde hydrolase [Planctomycetaceae bacterium]|nr:phosphonoacetaldehyde hydrolase [Planctomycetaceae bacterium]
MSESKPTRIELVVFDLGGTIVDHGCMAPVVAFVEAFRALGIEITTEQARGPMGLAKLDHIRELYKLPSVTEQWKARHDRDWSEEDVVATYERFLPMQTELAKQRTDIIPGLPECWSALREASIAIGTTTGYPRAVVGPILDALTQAGFQPAAHVCADEVPAGRPAPWMINRIMEHQNIVSPQAVVKVGDTVPDMEAARNANVWAIGITESGNEFGATKDELAALAPSERAARHEAAAQKLGAAGAHAIVRSLGELPSLVESGNFRQ